MWINFIGVYYLLFFIIIIIEKYEQYVLFDWKYLNIWENGEILGKNVSDKSWYKRCIIEF